MDKKTILQTLKELQTETKQLGFATVGLFGSFAKGEEHLYSDIDIAVRKDPTFFQDKGVYSYFKSIDELKTKLQSKLHRKIDIFDLDSQSPIKPYVEKEVIYV